MGLGILAGLTLSGPAAQAADYLTARPSNQSIYVDGQKVEFEAYSIHGNNFVKLRDIGRAVDFGVTYDAATNSVYINSAQPYQEETPAAPSGPTEESVQAALAQLKEAYPTGTVYGAFYRPNGGCGHLLGPKSLSNAISNQRKSLNLPASTSIFNVGTNASFSTMEMLAVVSM